MTLETSEFDPPSVWECREQQPVTMHTLRSPTLRESSSPLLDYYCNDENHQKP